MSESFSCTPTTTPESPTWATYMWTPRITTTLAVVPDVLGRPVIVFGHSAKPRCFFNKPHRLSLAKCAASRPPWPSNTAKNATDFRVLTGRSATFFPSSSSSDAGVLLSSSCGRLSTHTAQEAGPDLCDLSAVVKAELPFGLIDNMLDVIVE
ncbi:hypothetical protein EYF80_002949 [Liparis tanakae]|uniref:Uncharacterized protein n=1 Tax=Liparis tanakae TaxID=230148 RepID=A0A4Z2J968_9TELE|nr:hypothetical protein EYF80_002949 [Liparis tanakae]